MNAKKASTASHPDVKKIYVLSSNNAGLDGVVSTIALAHWFTQAKADQVTKHLGFDGSNSVFIPVIDIPMEYWKVKKEMINFFDDNGILTSDILFDEEHDKEKIPHDAKYILVGHKEKERKERKVPFLFAIDEKTEIHKPTDEKPDPRDNKELSTTAAKVWAMMTKLQWSTEPDAGAARLLRSATVLNSGNLENGKENILEAEYVAAMYTTERTPFFFRLSKDKDDPTGLTALQFLQQNVKFMDLGNLKIGWPYLSLSTWVRLANSKSFC